VATIFENIGNILIRFNKPKNLIHSAIDFEKAKIIGIIYQRENLLVQTTIDNLFESLEKKQKTVYSIEYIPPDIDTEYKLKEKNHFSLRKEDINIFKLPKKPIRENFCSIDFDILINLCPETSDFIHHIVSLSHSKLKVGLSNSKTGIYDFMVDAGESKDFKTLVNFVITYLEKIVKH